MANNKRKNIIFESISYWIINIFKFVAAVILGYLSFIFIAIYFISGLGVGIIIITLLTIVVLILTAIFWFWIFFRLLSIKRKK